LRFSHPDQAKGDSVRRQHELRDAWLKRHPEVKLDTSLTLEDKGVSGFTGEHRNGDRHALATFVGMVKAGRVPKGSYLIVESLDRLSREDITPALSLLLDLVGHGVKVVQLLPAEAVYDGQANPMQLMMAIMELSRGNSESKMKSERVGRAWREKKRRAAENGTPMTPTAPAWLKLTDGKWEVLDKAAAAVRRVFRLAVEGHGVGAIAKKLNAEGVPPIGRAGAWLRPYVAKVLRSRAAVGEYEPHARQGKKRVPDGDPVPGYYPAVITEQEWDAARGALASRRGKGGRPGKALVNLFAGIIFDARDGGPLQLRDRGAGRRLVSYRHTQGVPGACPSSFPLDAFEQSILSCLKEIDPREVLPKGKDDARDKVLTLAGRLAGLEGEVEKVKARVLARYTDALADVLEKLEARKAKLVEELAQARQEAANPLTEQWGGLASLLDTLANAPDVDEARTRLRAALRRVLTGVWCLFVSRGALRCCVAQCWFRGDGSRDYLVLNEPARGHGPEEAHRPARTWTRSLRDVTGAAPLDLRRTEHAAKLARALEQIDFKELLREDRQQVRDERNRRRRAQWQQQKDAENARRREKAKRRPK
jgi:DNA invertase Pin-like site-specific DNA recombinase